MSACEWPVVYGPGCVVPDGWDATGQDRPESQRMHEAMAIDFLWAWTGHRFGLCPTVIRPCRAWCPAHDHASTFHGRGPSGTGGLRVGPWQPVLIDGRWYNLTCGDCLDPCGCIGPQSGLALPGPVASVSEVLVDGQVVDPATYYRSGNVLYSARHRWPVCQDLSLPVTEPGTWQVTYRRGLEVPVGGQIAAGILAAELFKASCQDTTCALPQRLQSITRQGVTVAVLDSFDDIDRGHTGIWLIDSWVASVTRAPRRPVVYSPDLRPDARR